MKQKFIGHGGKVLYKGYTIHWDWTFLEEEYHTTVVNSEGLEIKPLIMTNNLKPALEKAKRIIDERVNNANNKKRV